MSIPFGVKLALEAEGVPQKTIADIERVLPNVERLLALRPEIEALYAKAKPDLDAVAPVVQEIITFVKGN